MDGENNRNRRRQWRRPLCAYAPTVKQTGQRDRGQMKEEKRQKSDRGQMIEEKRRDRRSAVARATVLFRRPSRATSFALKELRPQGAATMEANALARSKN